MPHALYPSAQTGVVGGEGPPLLSVSNRTNPGPSHPGPLWWGERCAVVSAAIAPGDRPSIPVDPSGGTGRHNFAPDVLYLFAAILGVGSCAATLYTTPYSICSTLGRPGGYASGATPPSGITL
jgi:hypothetical protein